MKVNRAFKYRLYPTTEQEEQLARQFGASRFVYNHFLRRRINQYAETGRGLSYHDTALELTELKKTDEYGWLKEANSQALQQSLRDLEKAYENFWSGRTRFPTFKKKHGRQSFRVPQHFKLVDDGIVLPKLSLVRAVIHRPIEGRMMSVTVSRTPTGKYFASILCEVELPDPEPRLDQHEIGIDLGLKDFIVTSEGERVPAPKHLRKSERRLKRLQRQMSRRKKGSRGRAKARLLVARQHEKVANQRADFHHKLSRRLVDENQAIYVESLAVKNMLANHKLAKSIADAGWGEFLRQLGYKGQWYGCRIGQLDRFFPSSKLDNECGYIYDGLKLSDRTWTCPGCGRTIDRDLNAAQNILRFGRRAGAALTHTLAESDVRPVFGQAASLKPEAQAL